jgi:hypothetical protein
MSRRPHVFGHAAILCVAALPACEAPRGDDRPVIATVGEHRLFVDDVPGPRDLADRRRSLDAVIARVLAAESARDRGLAEAAEVAPRLEALRRRALASEEALLRDALFQTLRDELKPTETDLRRHYEVTRLRYAERQVGLLWWPAPSADAARAQAQAAKLDRKKVETIGPVSVSDLPPKVVPEVFHLTKPGDRLAAGSEAEGFGVVELAEVLPAVTLPFERVRGRVEESWRTLEGQRAFAKLIEELRAEAEIEIDEAALANDALWAPAESSEGASTTSGVPAPQ